MAAGHVVYQTRIEDSLCQAIFLEEIRLVRQSLFLSGKRIDRPSIPLSKLIIKLLVLEQVDKREVQAKKIIHPPEQISHQSLPRQ